MQVAILIGPSRVHSFQDPKILFVQGFCQNDHKILFDNRDQSSGFRYLCVRKKKDFFYSFFAQEI